MNGPRSYKHPEAVLLTGASGGIGAALASAYAEPGRSLILQGRNRPKLDALASACRRRGAQVTVEALDLRDVAAWMRRVQDRCRLQPIDLAIINAGVTSHIGVTGEGESWASIEEIIDINVRAALATAQAVLPAMRQRGRGQIALVSSLSAYYGLPVTPAYCASKAALKAYGESLRGWLSPEGIAVNVVLPGFVETAMSARFPGRKMFVLRPDAAAEAIREGLARNQARISFPVPLSWGMWWLAVLPPGISERLVRLAGYGRAEDRQRGTG